MTAVILNRALSLPSGVWGGGRVSPGHNNRRGQDKNDGPVGVYAVVLLSFSCFYAMRLGAVPARKARRCLDFGGTMPSRAAR